MAQPFAYKITVFFRPGQPGSQAELTQRLSAELQEVFGRRAEQVAINTSPFSIPPGVFNVDLLVRDKTLVWELHSWVIEHARPHVPDSFAAMDAPAAGRSIVRARWVPLDSDWYNVELGKEYQSPANTYSLRCTKCGWPDYDNPPAPFLVDGCIATAGKNEFLPATNGIFVVSARVLEILSTHAGAEFRSGPVVSRSKKPMPGEFFWMRPVHRIGPAIGQHTIGTSCPSCGMPERTGMPALPSPMPLAPIIEHFGDPACNLALVGDFPLGDRPRDQESGVTFNVAVSGGLFAVLWNYGIKGLKWPEGGPYISKRPSEGTWDAERRFTDVFSPPNDKAAKYKPKH